MILVRLLKCSRSCRWAPAYYLTDDMARKRSEQDRVEATLESLPEVQSSSFRRLSALSCLAGNPKLSTLRIESATPGSVTLCYRLSLDLKTSPCRFDA